MVAAKAPQLGRSDIEEDKRLDEAHGMVQADAEAILARFLEVGKASE